MNSLSSVLKGMAHRIASGFSQNSELREDEPDWSELDKTPLPWEAFANWSSMNKDKKSTWKYPHHYIVSGKEEDGIFTSGTMYLHKAGLNAAWAASQGSRSGKKATP